MKAKTKSLLKPLLVVSAVITGFIAIFWGICLLFNGQIPKFTTMYPFLPDQLSYWWTLLILPIYLIPFIPAMYYLSKASHEDVEDTFLGLLLGAIFSVIFTLGFSFVINPEVGFWSIIVIAIIFIVYLFFDKNEHYKYIDITEILTVISGFFYGAGLVLSLVFGFGFGPILFAIGLLITLCVCLYYKIKYPHLMR